MKAMVLSKQTNAEGKPLKLANIPKPKPKSGEILVDIKACGVCRTDLHIIEGELPSRKLPLVPGHQIVGTVAEVGSGAKNFKKGDRVGVTWINSTCGRCEYCRSGRENLCDNIRFTGYDVDGGYSEYVVVSQQFAYKIPENFDDIHAAPLFCAGIVGYRALKLSGVRPGGTLAMFGFGSSASIVAQIAKHWGCDILAFTRGKEHQNLAKKLGAAWAGEASGTPSEKADAAIIFAPAGGLVANALENLKKGGRIAIADIYMTPIPEIDYNKHLYQERSITSVTNYTRSDAREFLDIANDIPIKTEVQAFKLSDANKALIALKQGSLKVSAVLKV